MYKQRELLVSIITAAIIVLLVRTGAVFWGTQLQPKPELVPQSGSISIPASRIDAKAASRPGVTRQNFQRLHIGMTVEQVETVMGSKSDLPTRLVQTWTNGDTHILILFKPLHPGEENRAAFGSCSSPDGPELKLADRPIPEVRSE